MVSEISLGNKRYPFIFSKDLNVTIKRCCHTLPFVYQCPTCDKCDFLYWFSIVVSIVVIVVGYCCVLMVALGNAVRWPSNRLGSYVLSQ